MVAEAGRRERTLAAFPERCLATRGGAIGYREAGASVTRPAPLVLLHGIGSGAASWVDQLAHFGATRRVVAWDAPGYGCSTPLAAAAPTAADYAAALAALVDGLGLPRFVLVGHSLGAMMAAAYAAAYSERIAGLVLLSPARGYGSAAAALRDERLASRLAMLERLGPEGLARERSAAMLSSAAPREALAWVAWNLRRLHPQGYRQAATMLAIDDIERYARRVTAEVHVASGEEDAITMIDDCRAVCAMFASASYEPLPGLGHALHVEDPSRVNALLAQWVGR